MNAGHLIRYYFRSVFSREISHLAVRKIRNARRRRRLEIIHKLPPLVVPIATPENVAIHLLTSCHEWREALWAIRSLLFQLGHPLPVVIHDDGSLHVNAINRMKAVLPGLKFIPKAEADIAAEQKLSDFPECRLARRQSVMGIKLFDPWISGEEDVILIDSDVLWFSRPVELLDWLAGSRKQNLWNGDLASAYSVDPQQIEHFFQVKLQPCINAGIGCIARASFDFTALETFLRHERETRHPWLMEQTSYAYLSSRYGTRLLPKSYAVGTPAGSPGPAELVAKHYVGSIRSDFYSEGLSYVTTTWCSQPELNSGLHRQLR